MFLSPCFCSSMTCPTCHSSVEAHRHVQSNIHQRTSHLLQKQEYLITTMAQKQPAMSLLFCPLTIRQLYSLYLDGRQAADYSVKPYQSWLIITQQFGLKHYGCFHETLDTLVIFRLPVLYVCLTKKKSISLANNTFHSYQKASKYEC